jgi:hypothetical protein
VPTAPPLPPLTLVSGVAGGSIARACGATIVHRPEEAKEEDIGTGAGVFKVEKLGDEYFSFIVDCVEPKACTIILRGASKDVLNEVRVPHPPTQRWGKSESALGLGLGLGHGATENCPWMRDESQTFRGVRVTPGTGYNHVPGISAGVAKRPRERSLPPELRTTV